MSEYTKQGLLKTGRAAECEFCHEPQHYGFCAEMNDDQKRRIAKGLPLPNPYHRSG